jgi:glycosyltransferase involved in cell wall biosynthesis
MLKSSMGSVFYIGNFQLPDGNAACQRVLSNAKLLNLSGMETHVITNNLENVSTSALNIYEGINCHSPVSKSSKWSKIYQFLTNSRIRKILSKTQQSGDIIILYNAPVSLIFPMYLYAKWKKCKLVLDLSEYYSSSGMSFPWGWLKSIDTFLRMNFCWMLAHGVITTSALLTKKYEKYCCKVIELPTLFDCSIFSPPTYRTDDITKLVYCGNPFNLSRKVVKERLDILIKSVASLDSSLWHLDIIGTTQSAFETMYPEYSQIISEESERIFFHGFLPRSDVLEFLKNADFQVFFRDATLPNCAGFPTKLSESVSAGVPVITNQLDGISRYSDANFLFIFDRGSELEQIMYCIRLDRTEKNKLKKEAYESRLFDYSSYLKEMKIFLNSLSR